MHKHSTNFVIIGEIIVSFLVGKYLMHIQSKNSSSILAKHREMMEGYDNLSYQ